MIPTQLKPSQLSLWASVITGITEKVVCVVTDNANNIVAAVRLNGWKHLSSSRIHWRLTHSWLKFKWSVVTWCHTSSIAARLLTSYFPFKPAWRLITQDVEMRWNSVFYTFENLIEQYKTVTITLRLLDWNSLYLGTTTYKKFGFRSYCTLQDVSAFASDLATSFSCDQFSQLGTKWLRAP